MVLFRHWIRRVLRAAHEASGVHHTARRRCSGMAAHGVGAAAGNAARIAIFHLAIPTTLLTQTGGGANGDRFSPSYAAWVTTLTAVAQAMMWKLRPVPPRRPLSNAAR